MCACTASWLHRSSKHSYQPCAPRTGRLVFTVLIRNVLPSHGPMKPVVFYSSPGIHYHGNKRHKKVFLSNGTLKEIKSVFKVKA